MYFSQIRVDPTNDKVVYVAGLPWAKSLDGGKTFVTLDEAGGNGEPGHVDQHAIWIDPKNPKHLLIGNDGGLNISWDQGKTWDFVNTMATALAYWVSAPTCAGRTTSTSGCRTTAAGAGRARCADAAAS